MTPLALAIYNIESNNGDPNSLAVRNNNPGNLKYAGQPGAVEDPATGFAVFSSWTAGVTALENQLKLYAQRGLTLAQTMNIYAPPSDNPNTLGGIAYAQVIASRIGVSVNDTIASILAGFSSTPSIPNSTSTSTVASSTPSNPNSNPLDTTQTSSFLGTSLTDWLASFNNSTPADTGGSTGAFTVNIPQLTPGIIAAGVAAGLILLYRFL